MTATLNHITNLLQNAPQDVLESVLGYVERLLESDSFSLMEETKAQMKEIAARPVPEHFTEEQVTEEIFKKYDF